MKKVLLATTMLAGTAGFASAEVSVTGYAEIGIWSYNYLNGGVWDNAVAFHQDVEVTFNMSGTTDGGLEFGAKIDLDEGDVPVNDDNGTEVWISGAFGKLTMGDTDGALDWALADMDGGMTSIADDHTTHAAWFGGADMDGIYDNQVVRYENTFGDVSFAISAEQALNGRSPAGWARQPGDTYGVAVKYNANLGGTDVALGLGYQQGDDYSEVGGVGTGGKFSAVGVSAAATLAGGFGGKIGYISFDDATWDNHVGLEVSYNSGPIGVAVNYGKVELSNGTTLPDGSTSFDSWGAVANYDLGGGAKVMFGYGSDLDAGTTGNQDQWSLGLGLSF